MKAVLGGTFNGFSKKRLKTIGHPREAPVTRAIIRDSGIEREDLANAVSDRVREIR